MSIEETPRSREYSLEEFRADITSLARDIRDIREKQEEQHSKTDKMNLSLTERLTKIESDLSNLIDKEYDRRIGKLETGQAELRALVDALYSKIGTLMKFLYGSATLLVLLATAIAALLQVR